MIYHHRSTFKCFRLSEYKTEITMCLAVVLSNIASLGVSHLYRNVMIILVENRVLERPAYQKEY